MKLNYENYLKKHARSLRNDRKKLAAEAQPVLQALDAVEGLSSPLREEVFVREVLRSVNHDCRGSSDMFHDAA